MIPTASVEQLALGLSDLAGGETNARAVWQRIYRQTRKRNRCGETRLSDGDYCTFGVVPLLLDALGLVSASSDWVAKLHSTLRDRAVLKTKTVVCIDLEALPDVPDDVAPILDLVRVQDVQHLAAVDSERELALVVELRDSRELVDKLRRQLRTTQQYARRVAAKLSECQHQLVEASMSVDANLNITRVGKSNKLTMEGSFALAIRKNIGTCSARALGATLLDSASHSTVTSSEIRCAAALLGHARVLCKQAYGSYGSLVADGERQPAPGPRQDGQPRDLDDFHVVVAAFRADATNTIIAMENKVHNLEAEILSKARAGDACHDEGPLKQQADLQYLPDCTAAAVHATIVKQLHSLGIKHWLDPDVVNAPQIRPEVRQVYAFCATTDQGPDQASMKRISQAEVAPYDHIQFWSVDCTMHQVQLVTRSGLTLVDEELKRMGKSYKYFGSLAKLANTWRECHKAIFQQWCTSWGDLNALDFAWRLPPRCIAGRWGSVVEVEKRVAPALNDSRLLVVLRDVFSKRKSRGDEDEDNKDDAGIDELRVEAIRSYSCRMSRWRRETVSTIEDSIFGLLVAIMLESHLILHRILCFLQKTFDDDTVDKIGGHVAQLVTGKAAAHSQQFSEKVEDCSWLAAIIVSVDDPADQSNLTRIGLSTMLHHAAAYDRRVRQVFERYPLRLLVMVKTAKDVACPDRQGIASEILSTDPELLELNTLKLTKIALLDLRLARDRGVCSDFLWAVLTGIRKVIKSDVQENEGVNSVIKHVVAAAPMIQLPLVDARVRLKRDLANGCNRMGHLLTSHKDRLRACHALLDRCRHGSGEGVAVTDTLCRWTPPAPSCVPDENQVKKLAVLQHPDVLRPTPQKLWATPYSYIVNKHVPGPDNWCVPWSSKGHLNSASCCGKASVIEQLRCLEDCSR